MKKLTLLFILLSTIAFGQNDVSVFDAKKKNIENQIKVLNDSLIIVQNKIRQIKLSNANNPSTNKYLLTTIRKGAKLRFEPNAVADVVLELKDVDTFNIIDYNDDYFKVCKDDTCGFVNEMYVNINLQVQQFIDNKKSIEEENQLVQKERLAKVKKVEEEKFIKKIGKDNYDKLLEGKYWIGMTAEMAMISFGAPNKINETVATWGNSEQWVYDNKLLYFENNKLVAIQR